MVKAIVVILVYICGSWATQHPRIETSLGTITGYHKSSYDGRTYSAFEGIPYATPPVDDLRFEEPQPAVPWEGILNANTSKTCMQIGTDANSVIGQEDCLYLNVYVPKEEPSESDNLDVLVYIHGGAFMIGQAGMGGPAFLMDRNIIYVNFNYRIGLLGFLSTEDDVVPGNNGLKDQQLALKWVQSHIKRFGGNPNSVTIMGLSAGGASVHFHYFSQLSKELFHRGISMSGTVLMPWAMQEAALEKTKKLGVLVECHDSQIRNIINCLKKVPGKELVGKTSNFYRIANFPIAPFAPVVEKNAKTAFLTESPYKLLLTGEFNDVPWMSTIVKDEGLAITMLIERLLDEVSENWNELLPILLEYNYTVAESNKIDVAAEITDTYFENNKLSSKNIDNLIALLGDRHFNVGFEIATQMQAKASKSPIYSYVYNYESEYGAGKLFGSNLKGVAHGDDGLLLHDMKFEGFPVDDRTLSPSDESMKNVLIDAITSFAIEGNPQVKGITWLPMTHEKFNYLYVPNVEEMQMFDSNSLTQWKFWESLDIEDYSRGPEIKDEL